VKYGDEEKKKAPEKKGDDVEDAASDMLEAFEKKDAKGLALALRRACVACAAEES
jgi:hypothetical protein